MRESIGVLMLACGVLSLRPACAQTQYTADGLPTGLEEEIRWRVNRGRFDTAGENQARGTSYTGLPASAGPLAPNQSLTLAARHHSEDMARNNVFQHETVQGRAYYNASTQPEPWDRMEAEGYAWNNAGENIAAGYSGAESVYVGWWNSSGHRANMYNAALREIGNGYYNLSGSSYRSYYTMDLGSSGSTCFLTDTLFRDTNGNGVYDQAEAVSNVAVRLFVGATAQSAYDSSSAVGSFAVPLTSIPSGTTVQVVLSNTTASALTLSVPRSYQTLNTVSLAPGEARACGTFIRPSGARNVGLRDLTAAAPSLVSARLAARADQSGTVLTWPSTAGQRYVVQSSTDLVTWTDLAGAQPGTGSPLTVTDTSAAPGGRKFYRLRILSP